MRTHLIPTDETRRFPLDCDYLPKPVAEANAKAHKAAERDNAASQDRDYLAEEVKAAPRIDEHAAIQAEAEGKKPPAPTLPAKRAALADAERKAEATHRALSVATGELYEAVELNYDATIGPFEERAEEAAGEMVRIVTGLAERIATFQQTNRDFQILRMFRNNAQVAELSVRDTSSAFTRQFEKAVEQRRRILQDNRRALIQPDLISILAALQIEMEYELAGDQNSRHERPNVREMAGRTEAGLVRDEAEVAA